jgi:hypothetical protein
MRLTLRRRIGRASNRSIVISNGIARAGSKSATSSVPRVVGRAVSSGSPSGLRPGMSSCSPSDQTVTVTAARTSPSAGDAAFDVHENHRSLRRQPKGSCWVFRPAVPATVIVPAVLAVVFSRQMSAAALTCSLYRRQPLRLAVAVVLRISSSWRVILRSRMAPASGLPGPNIRRSEMDLRRRTDLRSSIRLSLGFTTCR